MITMAHASHELHDLIDSRFEDLAKRILDELKQSQYSKEFFKALDLILIEPIEKEFNKLHENTMTRLIDLRTKKIQEQQKQQQILKKQYDSIEQRQVSIEVQLQKFGRALVDTNNKSNQLAEEQQQIKLQCQPIVVEQQPRQHTKQQEGKNPKQSSSSIPMSTITSAVVNNSNINNNNNRNSFSNNHYSQVNVTPKNSILVTQASLEEDSRDMPQQQVSAGGSLSTTMYPVVRSASDNASDLKRHSSLRQHQQQQPRVATIASGRHNLVADIVAQRQQLDQRSQQQQGGSILKKSSSQTNTKINHMVPINGKPTQATITKPMTNKNGMAAALLHTYDHDVDGDDDDDDDDEDEDDDDESFGELTSFPHRSSICVQKLNSQRSKLIAANDQQVTGETCMAPSVQSNVDNSKQPRRQHHQQKDESQQRLRQPNPIVRSNTLGGTDTKDRYQQQQQASPKQPRQFKQPESSDQPRSMILSSKEMASLYKPHMNYSTSALGNYRLSDDDEIIIIPTTMSPSLLGSASPDPMDQSNADELTERFSISRTKSFWEKLSKGKEASKQSAGGQSEHSGGHPITMSPSSLSVSPQPNSASYGRHSAQGGKGGNSLKESQSCHHQQQQQHHHHVSSDMNHIKDDFNKKQQSQADQTHQLDRMDSTGGSNSNYSCSSSGDEATNGYGNVIMVNGSDMMSPSKPVVSRQRHSKTAAAYQQHKPDNNQSANNTERTISQLQAEMMTRQNKFRQTK